MAHWDGDGIEQHWAITFRSFVYEDTKVHVDIDGNTADAKATTAKVYVDIDGNKADAKAKADAYGNDTFTAALTADGSADAPLFVFLPPVASANLPDQADNAAVTFTDALVTDTDLASGANFEVTANIAPFTVNYEANGSWFLS